MEIKINGYDWQVDFVDADKVSMNPLEGGVNLGLTEYLEQKISIRVGMSEKMTYTTVVHELCHAFLFSYGMFADAYDNEQLCNFFGAYGREIISLADQIMEGEVKDAHNG